MVTNEQIAELQAAMAHQKAGRLSDAAKAYNRLLQQMPGNFGCIYSLAMIYAQQGNFDSAADMFRRAAQIRPDLLDAHYNLAVALSMAGRSKEAALSYETVLKINPRHANARNNYATTLLQAGRATDALRQYDELVAQVSASADAYNNRGMALQALRRSEEAVADYDKAINLKPNFVEAYVNRGNALTDLHRTEDALASYRKAVALRPDFADAYNNMGNIYYNLGSYQEAIAAYDKGLSLHADDSEARSNRFSAKMHLCDWSNFPNERADLVASVGRGLPTYPFVMLAVSSSVEDHLQCARQFSRTRFPASDEPLWRGEIYSHDRIRVAYVSGEFREHPIAYLTASLFEHHDRSRFEVTAISFGPDHDRPITRRLKSAFERYIDARATTDAEIADLLRRLEIDIAVDLVGYLQNARTTIFSRRPAPIQVNYIGYPGTLGADYFDYIIADPTVLPPQHAGFYTEKVAWLPDTYLSTDATRPIAPTTPSRRDLGLPEDGFVFCCFNLLYKNNPEMFDVWMRLLRELDNSVLWLRDYNAVTSQNLRAEAQRRGIAPERLVFAPRVPSAADHLARQRQADLFLDTLPYNAHTTGTEALWVGLPVLTCLGSSFAGRVGASINKAIGMPELVTNSLAEYEALALKIARDPALCTALKEKLARNRASYPLFDTARLTRHVETAYEHMWQTYRDGRPPAGFAVESNGRSRRV